MGIDLKKKRLAKSFHAMMTPRNYGKYLFLKHKQEIELFFLSHDLLVPEEEMEKICSLMMHDLFNSFGQCIRSYFEVRVAPVKSKKNFHFEIKYSLNPFNNKLRYETKQKRREALFRRSDAREFIEKYKQRKSGTSTPRIDTERDERSELSSEG